MNYDEQRRRVEMLKEQYPPGTRIELISMSDPYSPIESGTRGSVSVVDDAATLHMAWDNGRTLGLVPGEDEFRTLTPEEVHAEQQAQITVKSISVEEFCKMTDKEGLIIQGCGGDLNEWAAGINRILSNEKILLNGSTFEEVSTFEHDGLTNLLFPFENADMNIAKLAIWRLNTHSQFNGVWASDYRYNVFGLSDEAPEQEKEIDADIRIYREPETVEEKIQAEIQRAGASHNHNAIQRIREYMSAVDNAEPLVAEGLQEGYKIICEYGNHVLAGMKYSGNEAAQGYQFATWEYTYGKTGLTNGHYYSRTSDCLRPGSLKIQSRKASLMACCFCWARVVSFALRMRRSLPSCSRTVS